MGQHNLGGFVTQKGGRFAQGLNPKGRMRLKVTERALGVTLCLGSKWGREQVRSP